MGYDTIITELEAMREAVESEDVAELDQTLDRLSDAYDVVTDAEKSRLARLQAARPTADLSPDDHTVISTYERWFMTTYFGRGSILAAGDLYQLDPDMADADELVEQTTALIDREEGLRGSTSAITEVIDQADVPPRLGVLEFAVSSESVLVGDTVSVALLVQNVGDEAAMDIAVQFTADGLDVSESTEIGSLDPDEYFETTFEVVATGGDTIEFSVSVDSANAGSVTERTTLTVRTKDAIVQTAMETLESLRERITSRSLDKSRIRSITANIDAALQSLNRCHMEINRGRNKQANNAITTAMNQLGALLNSIAATSGRNSKNDLDAAFRTTLENRTSLVIDHLADARSIAP